MSCCAIRVKNGQLCGACVFKSDEPYDLCALHFGVAKKRGISLADGTLLKLINDGKDPCLDCGKLISRCHQSLHRKRFCQRVNKELKEIYPKISRIEYVSRPSPEKS